MGAYTRTYSLTDGTIAYGSQVAFELDALGSSVNNITNAQISSGAAIADSKLAQITTASKVNLTAVVATSQAQGDVFYASSASVISRLGAGTSGQFLQTLGAGANPAWATPAFIVSQTGSPSAVSSFTISSLSAGTKYKLVLNLTQNTSNAFLTLKFNADGGANYKYGGIEINGAGFTGWANQSDTSISLIGTGDNILAASKLFGVIDFASADQNNNAANLISNICYNDGSNSRQAGALTMGAYSGASSIVSLVITPSAGTMTGTWTLYALS